MSARPELSYPGNDAVVAAMSRTLTALSAVFQALGDGEHTLNLVVERTDDTVVTGRTDLSIGMEPSAWPSWTKTSSASCARCWCSRWRAARCAAPF